MNAIKSLIFGAIATLALAVAADAQVLIKPGKAISITISGVPAGEKSLVDGNYPVSESGMINLPHVGTVKAAGLKADELSKVIEATFKSRQIYTNPTVQVMTSSMDSLDKQQVHVGGQVGHTGPVEFTQGLTLYQAVQAAGGASPFGSMYRVKLYRAGKMSEYDLTQGKNISIPLMPSDTIEVPQKNWRGH